MTAYLAYAALLGMSVASMVTIFRAVWPGKQLAATGRKPWACDVCMTFWGTLLLAAVHLHLAAVHFKTAPVAPGPFLLYVCAPALIVCLWLLRQTADIELPSDPDDTDEGDKNE